MLVVVICTEFIKETLKLVNEIHTHIHTHTHTHTHTHICWVTCIEPKIGLSDVACMVINWVRISCSC